MWYLCCRCLCYVWLETFRPWGAVKNRARLLHENKRLAVWSLPKKQKKISTVPSRELCPTRQRTRTATCVGSIKRIFFYAIGFLLLVFSSSWLYRFSPDVPTFQLWIFKTRGQKSHESEIEPRIRETPVRREKADPLDCWLDRMRPSLTNFVCLWNSRTIFSQSFVTSVRLLSGKKKKIEEA